MTLTSEKWFYLGCRRMGYDRPTTAFVTDAHIYQTTPQPTLSASTRFHMGSKHTQNQGEHHTTPQQTLSAST